MRLAAIALSLFIATPALADAERSSLVLYEAVAAGAKIMAEQLDVMGEAPASAGAMIKAEVRNPVSAAETQWMAQMVEAGPETFLPYFPCQQASLSLQSMAADLETFLLDGGERPDVNLDLDYFKSDLTSCETALGRKPTFSQADN